MALVVSAMIVLMIVIVASVLFYTYSTGLLGSLEAVNPPVTMDSLRIEAYNWESLTSLVLNVRNTGVNTLTMNTAQWLVAGVVQSPVSTCGITLAPGASCAATITLSGVTVSSGIVYVVKIVLSDGSIFSTLAIAGQVTGETGVT